jgi:hypothetical protein
MSFDRIALLIGQAGRIILIAGIGLSPFTSALAFEPTSAQRQACTPDAFRLCGSEIPDVGRVTACMSAKKALLSAPCRAVFESARLEHAAPPSHQAHTRKTASAYAHNRQPPRHHLARS